jgi:hypothetical protein
MVNVAVRDPASTATAPGTCAAAVLLLCSVTVMPPLGAAPLNVTVPVALLPPTTELGLLVTDARVGALTVSVVVNVVPYPAEITTDVFVATGVVVIVNVALLDPAGIVTLGGT